MELRIAGPRDLGAVDALLSRAYPAILKADYPPSVLVTALPLISRANPALLRSGTYWLAEDAGGRLLGAGGWTSAAPVAGDGAPGLANVRHVVTDPDALRRGIARQVLGAAMAQAREAGMEAIAALSTRTAVPFYAALGFARFGSADIALRPGIEFPAIRMARRL